MQRPRTQVPVIAPDLVVPFVEDDTEEAPWMVMGDAQFWAAAHLATSLHHYAQVHDRPWYVASLLPIVYRRPGERRTRQVAPDVLVAFVPQRPRDSYNLAAEGGFPAFVLEVVSSSSVARDVDAKRRLYEALGAQEYVLFAPEPGLLEPRLQGHRRGGAL
jgi:Uma2 family endonuclease